MQVWPNRRRTPQAITGTPTPTRRTARHATASKRASRPPDTAVGPALPRRRRAAPAAQRRHPHRPPGADRPGHVADHPDHPHRRRRRRGRRAFRAATTSTARSTCCWSASTRGRRPARRPRARRHDRDPARPGQPRPGVPDLHPARLAGVHPGVRQDRLPRRHQPDQRGVLPATGARAPNWRSGRAAWTCSPAPCTRPPASPSTARRSSTSPASRRWSADSAGVYLCVDQRATSIHLAEDREGNYRPVWYSESKGIQGLRPGERAYVHEPGCRRMPAELALDYARDPQEPAQRRLRPAAPSAATDQGDRQGGDQQGHAGQPAQAEPRDQAGRQGVRPGHPGRTDRGLRLHAPRGGRRATWSPSRPMPARSTR